MAQGKHVACRMETQNKTESLEQTEIKNLLLFQITPLNM